jgi:hypothetical protein
MRAQKPLISDPEPGANFRLVILPWPESLGAGALCSACDKKILAGRDPEICPMTWNMSKSAGLSCTAAAVAAKKGMFHLNFKMSGEGG